MQVRCIYCLREQYAMAVFEVSHGRSPCVWCGYKSAAMDERTYRAMLAARRLIDGSPGT
jgi:hypothetical protein